MGGRRHWVSSGTLTIVVDEADEMPDTIRRRTAVRLVAAHVERGAPES
ncbi:MAG: hypothetical protein H0V12_08465 [Chloroflexi bacterium]|nr:hypothetical protein [Chloroflexota bacterium]